MCIRDRQSAAQLRLQGEREARELRSRLEKLQAEIEQTESCLLYTSDAADERSSVDLGGRRIIKKKKHT